MNGHGRSSSCVLVAGLSGVSSKNKALQEILNLLLGCAVPLKNLQVNIELPATLSEVGQELTTDRAWADFVYITWCCDVPPQEYFSSDDEDSASTEKEAEELLGFLEDRLLSALLKLVKAFAPAGKKK